MTKKKMKKTFDKYEGDFGNFNDISRSIGETSRPDLYAFILLDKLSPGNHDIIVTAKYDEIYLAVETEKLAKTISEEQIRTLVRCGISYDESEDCLYAFV